MLVRTNKVAFFYRYNAPSLDTPALLSANSSLLQRCELPQVVDSVKVPDLDEPCSYTFHNLTASPQALAPMSLPLKKITWVESVGAELKDTSESAWWRRWPEGELLHQRHSLRVDKLLQLLVKCWEIWVLGNGVERLVISIIFLILPDVDCRYVRMGLRAVCVQNGQSYQTCRSRQPRFSSYRLGERCCRDLRPPLGTNFRQAQHTHRPHQA